MTQFSELHDALSKPWTQISSFTALVFLLLTQNCAGQSQVVSPSQPVLAMVGDGVLLSCRLEPGVDASGMSIEWSRGDLDPSFVYVWWDREELESSKHPDYKGRTSLLFSKLKFGDVSLKLSKVKPSDEGKYECFIPSLGQGATVELVVGHFFLSQSSYISVIVGFAVSLAATFIQAVVLFVHTGRHNRKMKRLETENQQYKGEKLNWMKTERKLKAVIQNMNMELAEMNFDPNSDSTGSDTNQQEELEKLRDEQQKWMKTVGNLKTELQNMNQELKLTGPITLEDVSKYGFYIRLKNISSEEIKLGDWRLELQINNREPAILVFDESLQLQAGEILCMRQPNWSSKHPEDVDLVWSDMIHWSHEDKLQINFTSTDGESFRLL